MIKKYSIAIGCLGLLAAFGALNASTPVKSADLWESRARKLIQQNVIDTQGWSSQQPQNNGGLPMSIVCECGESTYPCAEVKSISSTNIYGDKILVEMIVVLRFSLSSSEEYKIILRGDDHSYILYEWKLIRVS